MSSVIAKCPKCSQAMSVGVDVSEETVTCPECQSTFTPAKVIAESNKRFEIGMYIAMLAVGVGLIVYMAMTGNLKPKADDAGGAPAAEADAAGE